GAYRGTNRQELLRQIAFEDPRPLRRLNRAVPAELETIVLKAMAKSPDERYASAQELADDLHRFLDDRPIRARRPSPLQLLAKWGRRNRRLVVTAVVSAVLAPAGGLVGVWQERREALRQRDAADLQRRRAEGTLRQAHQAVNDYLTLVSENTLLAEPALEPLRKQLLTAALRYYQQFVA